MPNESKDQVPQDLARINVGDPLELAYWSRKFSESPDKLRQLVLQHGLMVSEIEQALGRNASLI
jgi:hypothetical protein